VTLVEALARIEEAERIYERDGGVYTEKAASLRWARDVIVADPEFHLSERIDNAASKLEDREDTKGRWWRPIPYEGWQPGDDE
jgi:hypothetical protein